MRHCEMCGAVIPQGVNVCESCGGIISEEDSGADRIIGNPDWGKISIDLGSYQGDASKLVAKIKIFWIGLESRSAQRLFGGQMDNPRLLGSTIELYGPRESFIALMRELNVAGLDPLPIEFCLMSYDEIYRVRDSN